MTEYRPPFSHPNFDETWRSSTHEFPTRVDVVVEGMKGAPNVSATIEMRDGVPEVVDFRITSTPGDRPVRTADLKSWPVEGLAVNVMRRCARSLIDRPVGDTDPPVPWRHDGLGPRTEREFWSLGNELLSAQESRRGPAHSELEEVAQIYRAALDERPVEAVQVQCGYSRRTAARRVQQARAAGLLPPTTQGKRKA